MNVGDCTIPKPLREGLDGREKLGRGPRLGVELVVQAKGGVLIGVRSVISLLGCQSEEIDW